MENLTQKAEIFIKKTEKIDIVTIVKDFQPPNIVTKTSVFMLRAVLQSLVSKVVASEKWSSVNLTLSPEINPFQNIMHIRPLLFV